MEWYLDSDIHPDKQGEHDLNYEPLLVNTVNSWCDRPQAHTNIPNFFLASDYVRTFTDLATMEGANEAARRAVNSIIDRVGVNEPLCDIWNLHEPDILAPFKLHDKKRYEMGLPYQYHEPFLMKVAEEVEGLVSNAKKEVKSVLQWVKEKL